MLAAVSSARAGYHGARAEAQVLESTALAGDLGIMPTVKLFPCPPAKRYGIAAIAFAEFVWLLREAGIEWEFVHRPVAREERVMIDVQIEAGDRVRVGSSTLYFDRDVIRVADH